MSKHVAAFIAPSYHLLSISFLCVGRLALLSKTEQDKKPYGEANSQTETAKVLWHP